MWITPRKITGGHAADLAMHVRPLLQNPPEMLLSHLPYGGDPARMPLDSIILARQIPALSLVVNDHEFVSAYALLAPQIPDTTFGFYQGCPAHSPTLQRAWDIGNLRGINDRVNSCLQPFIKLRQRLPWIRICLWLDAAVLHGKNSLTKYCFDRITINHGFQCGVEARVLEVSEWANRADVPVLAWREDWYNQAHWPGVIPEQKLLGRQWLICRTEEECQVELAAGRSVMAAWHRAAVVKEATDDIRAVA